jgi:hypothetical protein
MRSPIIRMVTEAVEGFWSKSDHRWAILLVAPLL